MTLEDLIDALGDSFRGLWRSYYLDGGNEPNIKRWSVTFIFRGHYVETPEQETPSAALVWALKKLEEAP